MKLFVEHQSFAFFFTEDENDDDNSKMGNGDTYVEALLPIHLNQKLPCLFALSFPLLLGPLHPLPISEPLCRPAELFHFGIVQSVWVPVCRVER